MNDPSSSVPHGFSQAEAMSQLAFVSTWARANGWDVETFEREVAGEHSVGMIATRLGTGVFAGYRRSIVFEVRGGKAWSTSTVVLETTGDAVAVIGWLEEKR